jgi:hypothetical protein
MTRVKSMTDAKDFSFSLYVQTSSEAHPASYPVGTGEPFQGVKHSRGVTLTTHPHPVLRSRMSRSYTPLSLSIYMARSAFTLLSQHMVAKILKVSKSRDECHWICKQQNSMAGNTVHIRNLKIICM